MAEYNVECHYSTFCSYVPTNIVKPRPQDWGTCLCMTCLNPELKLEALKKFDKLNQNLELEALVKSEQEVSNVIKRLNEAAKETISFLYWTKEKASSTDELDTSILTYESNFGEQTC